MTALIDLTGKVFGRLTVIRRIADTDRPRWECRCECGCKTQSTGQSLRRGGAQSCGCLRTEIISAAKTKHGCATNGLTPEYRSWASMIQRCENPNSNSYSRYGGAGVAVCTRWRNSFAAFFADMGPRPAGTTLDRHPNKAGNYEPGNVRWADKRAQANNRRTNRVVTYAGRELTLAEAVRAAGGLVTTMTAWKRLKRGWPIERAVQQL